MGVTQTTGGRKKRPQPTAELDPAAVSVRREKNRQAQHVFRKRKQATEAAQVRRIRRLEDVVEEMSGVVMRVFDAILETESLTTNHPSLVSCLDEALARVLELAKEVVDVDEDSQAIGGEPATEVPALTTSGSSSSSSAKQDDEEDSLVMLSVAESDSQLQQMYMQTSTSGAASTTPFTDFLPDASSSTIILDPNLFTPSQPEIIEPPIMPPPNWRASQPQLPPQLFSNGWASKKMPGPTDSIFLPPTTFEFQARLRDLGSFTQRLTEHIISYGYACLINSPGISATVAAAEVERAFGYTLRFRTKQQMIDTLQWFLGPGKEYMYRASGYTWGGRGGTTAEFPDGLGPKPRMRDLLPEERLFQGDHDAEADFLTAVGVHEELKNLGAKLVDTDTIEIKISSQSRSSDGRNWMGTGRSTQANTPETWNGEAPDHDEPPLSPSGGSVFGFLLKRRRERQLTLRLNMTLLITNLSRHSVCFLRGPAFPRHELGEMVQASVVTAHWS